MVRREVAHFGRGALAVGGDFGAARGISDGLVVDRWTQQVGLSPHTARAYIGEAHRFLAWLANSVCCANGVSIPTLLLPYVTEDHAGAYAAWLSSEITPQTNLAVEALLAYGIKSAPRRKPLRSKSIVQSLSLLHAMWEFAQTHTATADAFPRGNPFAEPLNAKRRESKSAKDKMGEKKPDAEVDDHKAKFLNPAAWRFVEQALAVLSDQHRWRGERAKRAQLVYALAYYLALRIHEIWLLEETDLVPPSSAGEKWEIHVTGKGGTREPMSLPTEVEVAIRRYRPRALEIGHSGQQKVPLVAPLKGQAGGSKSKGRTSLSTLARIFKFVSESAAALAKEAGELGAAKKLERATAHWCRHARISHLLNDGAPPRLVQKLARHKSAQTTQIYDHSDSKDVMGPIDEATRKHHARLQELNR